MKTKLLKLSEIVTTAGTQIRAKIDADTVDQYAEAMQDATNKFPPVVVFHDGSQFILADGFHRVMAASRNGFLDIESDVRKGTRADALKHALGANSTHGLKRTNSDKRRSVELALAEWPKMGSNEMSKVCAVSHTFIDNLRREHATVASSPANETRIGADGKERKLPTRKPEPAPEPELAQPEEPEEHQACDETPEPPKHRTDEAWSKALGVESPTNFWAAQVEDIVSSALENGTAEQLQALKGALKAALKQVETRI